MSDSRGAVLIGIDDYPGSKKLFSAGSDARRVHGLLRENADGSPNFKCTLVTNEDQPEIRRVDVLEQAERLLLHSSVDVALLYFAGHGGVDDVGGFLLAQDSHSGRTGVRMAELLAMANASKVPQIVVLVDTCSANAMGAPDNRAVLREGLSILTGAHERGVAQADIQGGLFTTVLCGALDEGAADVRGQVTVAGTYAYVDESFGAFRQRPELKAHVSRLVVLRRCKPSVSDVILRRLPEWFSSAEATHELSPRYEPTAKPPDIEREEIFGILQKCRAAKLVEPVDHEHMYDAAMQSGACRLTALGRHYWQMAARQDL